MFAVVKIGGSQYLVSPGDEIVVDRLEGESNSKLTLDSVLLTADGDKIAIGTPFLPDVKVAAVKIEDKKGEKIRVFKFKAKSRYHKTIGFRAGLSKLRIESISSGSEPTPKSSPKTSPRKKSS